MPPMQQSTQSTVDAMPAMLETFAAASFNEYDDALGCECAYPSLQIERWGQDGGDGEIG
jgi:hypothetical protein